MTDKADLCKEIGRSHAVIMRQENAIAVLAELADAERQYADVSQDRNGSLDSLAFAARRVYRARLVAAKNPIAAKALKEAKP